MPFGTVHEGEDYRNKKVDVVAVCNVLRSVAEAAGAVSKKLAFVTISTQLWSMGKTIHREIIRRDLLKKMKIKNKK